MLMRMCVDEEEEARDLKERLRCQWKTGPLARWTARTRNMFSRRIPLPPSHLLCNMFSFSLHSFFSKSCVRLYSHAALLIAPSLPKRDSHRWGCFVRIRFPHEIKAGVEKTTTRRMRSYGRWALGMDSTVDAVYSMSTPLHTQRAKEGFILVWQLSPLGFLS